MFDLPKMIKQAQKLQEQMGKVQEELEHIEVTAQDNAQKVSITTNCKFEFKSVSIDPDFAKSADAEALNAAVLEAIQNAINLATAETEKKMSVLTSGLNIPGLKLPF